MKDKLIKVSDIAKELGLYLKVVTSTSFFENYNSFFNLKHIFSIFYSKCPLSK